MSRNLAGNLETETLADNLAPILLAEFEFSGGTVNFWTGFGNLAWDGKTWTGTGYFGTMSALQETTATQATGAKFMLSGIPTEVVSIAFGETYQGRPARVWFGAMDENNKLVSDPYQIFGGRMDVMEISEGADDATIVLNAENELIDMQRIREFRYTAEDQAVYFPGDTGFDMVPALQDQEIVWGRTLGPQPTAMQLIRQYLPIRRRI